MSLKKIEREKKRHESVLKYKDFVKSLDLKPIVYYFEYGVDAGIFKNRTGKRLEKNDDLWWGFNHGKYQYTLRRQSIKENSFMSAMNVNYNGGN